MSKAVDYFRSLRMKKLWDFSPPPTHTLFEIISTIPCSIVESFQVNNHNLRMLGLVTRISIAEKFYNYCRVNRTVGETEKICGNWEANLQPDDVKFCRFNIHGACNKRVGVRILDSYFEAE